MQKQYDDFVKLKVKEMSRTISKLTYTYLDPDCRFSNNLLRKNSSYML